MTWRVTLVVTDCATGAALSGASVSDGFYGRLTNSYGQADIDILDDYEQYGMLVAKADYDSRTFTFARSHIGRTQTTCLNYKPPPPTRIVDGKKQKNIFEAIGLKCFIITAATGSSHSNEATELRALRDRIAATSSIAGRLIDAIYEQYWHFSPAIADQIRDSDSARMGVLTLVVRPLFAWYGLAGKLALCPTDTIAIQRAEMELLAACPRHLGRSKVVTFLSALARGDPLPASAPTLAVQLAPKLRDALALPLANWAIFYPLVRTWSGAAERLDMKREVAGWLGSAPVEVLPPPPPKLIERELAELSSLLAFDENARRQLGCRLHSAWPTAATALRKAGMWDNVP